MKAIGLLSGGLDSELAIKLISDQGIEVQGLHFTHTFCTPVCTPIKPNIIKVTQELGIALEIIDINEAILDIVRHPKHGYGSGMNPCIDCRIVILRKAKEYMEKAGAKFVVTGEVLGQRPMSQNKKAIELIESESGLAGLIVRPLCAQTLPPSLPEQQGWIDREKLLGHHGRSRKTQIALAKEYDFRAFSTPAGGCLLTDPGFTKRITESRQHEEDSLLDIELLKLGRHFRIKDDLKCIVGRDQKENELLTHMASTKDLIMEPVNVPGPTILLREGHINYNQDYREAAAKICVSYCNSSEDVVVRCGIKNAEEIIWQNNLMISIPQSRDNLKSVAVQI